MLAVLALILLIAAVTVFGLAGYGFGTLGRAGLRRPGPGVVLRSAAAVLGAVAVACYAVGLLGVAGAVLEAHDGGADSAPIRPCRTGSPERDAHIADYSVRYVPLGFVCETADGASYVTDDVPAHLNSAAAGTALAAVACAVAAALHSERRARQNRPRPQPQGS
ncbi:hypothetical protein OG552_16715 [Streptomyces sp. NBC_01476]|uniref:hypothetical protein n=1 Tax=Streptomyces sp. NBC_01476 TaxID=2903881 RepID=UPI002E2F65A1|nr:hypothetical protein [Streptomyces sp. NBC_01476]